MALKKGLAPTSKDSGKERVAIRAGWFVIQATPACPFAEVNRTRLLVFHMSRCRITRIVGRNMSTVTKSPFSTLRFFEYCTIRGV
jgi:hypothetical protein